MARHKLTFVELHNQLFMQGSNHGTKIKTGTKGIQFVYDDALEMVLVRFNGRTAAIPAASVASMDFANFEVKEFGDGQSAEDETHQGPPAVARAKRAQQRVEQELSDPMAINPGDSEDEAAHRARVRAASSNAFKAQTQATTQNDTLIQQARGQALGFKSAQVETPGSHAFTGVKGKPKAISHAQLNAQLAAEQKAVK